VSTPRNAFADRVRFLALPSQFAVIVPAPTFVPSPISASPR
jgi:hypothetical protein